MKLYVISPDNVEKIKVTYNVLINLDSSYFKHIYAFQLRIKVFSNINLYEKYIVDIRNICRQNDIYFIINDNFDLMMLLNADGIHVGIGDGRNFSKIKEYNKANIEHKKIIGISCYNQLQRGIDNINYINYVSFGCFFSSQTKTDPIAISKPKIIQEWKDISSIPCCAIGGVNEDNIGNILIYKPNYIAISGYIWNNDNSLEIIKNLINLIK